MWWRWRGQQERWECIVRIILFYSFFGVFIIFFFLLVLRIFFFQPIFSHHRSAVWCCMCVCVCIGEQMPKKNRQKKVLKSRICHFSSTSLHFICTSFSMTRPTDSGEACCACFCIRKRTHRHSLTTTSRKGSANIHTLTDRVTYIVVHILCQELKRGRILFFFFHRRPRRLRRRSFSPILYCSIHFFLLPPSLLCCH